jgi:predicted DNA binding CopG/RHH family protein
VETKRSELSARGKPAGRNAGPMRKREIDFSDIPESTDAELRKARKIGRPKCPDAKTLIAIRIRASLLRRIRHAAKIEGKPYQTFIHEILEQTMSAGRSSL